MAVGDEAQVQLSPVVPRVRHRCVYVCVDVCGCVCACVYVYKCVCVCVCVMNANVLGESP